MSKHHLPALPTDIPTLVSISLAAFSGTPTYWPLSKSSDPSIPISQRPNHINTLFYTRDPFTDTEVLKWQQERYGQPMREDADVRIMKIVERKGEGEGEGKEEVLAFARWWFYLTGSGEEKEKEGGEEGREGKEKETKYPDSVRAGLVETFFGKMKRERKEIMGGRPYILLASLATHPDHYRKGAGSMLLSWGTERADGAGLEIYLESSAAGKSLYEKHGFETIKILETDLEKHGGQGSDKRWLMIRKPKSK
ncbi:MAG: hypothetical protein M1820_000270 [Bogoriella megaspora]|nr:MAG: hypothetical protein M1820_000270 [Bogoriella megaspora]